MTVSYKEVIVTNSINFTGCIPVGVYKADVQIKGSGQSILIPGFTVNGISDTLYLYDYGVGYGYRISPDKVTEYVNFQKDSEKSLLKEGDLVVKPGDQITYMTFEDDGEGIYTRVFAEVPDAKKVLSMLIKDRDTCLEEDNMEGYVEFSKFIYIVTKYGLPEKIDGKFNTLDEEGVSIGIDSTLLT